MAWLVKNGKTFFSKLTQKSYLTLVFLSQTLRYFSAIWVVISVEYLVLFTLGNVYLILNKYFWFLPKVKIYRGKNQEPIAVKNFVFLEIWVGEEVTDMKITCFVIFCPNWTHILAPKDPIMELLKQYFNIQSIKKTKLPIILLWDWLTKVKSIVIVIFCPYQASIWP